ncbi:MAG: VOC family protein [Ferruginibacter sp.]
MAAVNPYLNFNGNAGEAFNFYKSVFGGEFITLQHYSDMPSTEPALDSNPGKVLHVALPIGQGTVLMASDVPDSDSASSFVAGNNYSVCINTESEEEATKLFDGLSAGGQITMPLAKAFWGAYFGMFNDKFGVQWMVNYTYEQPPS